MVPHLRITPLAPAPRLERSEQHGLAECAVQPSAGALTCAINDTGHA